jgi:PPM family protein phosphatase
MTLALRFVARSDVGLVREGNEDSGYAGPFLLAVADGMGGHAAGEVASSVALSTLATLEDDVPSTELLDALAGAVNEANAAISDMVEKHPQLDGMGTTLTALLWSGRRLGLVHVGDSRAYLLRGNQIRQITHDHTFVQQLQDEGRITAEEAAVHPQRSLLLRCLDGRSNPEPDLSVREVLLGDRYLVCSDGLSGVVSDEQLAEALAGDDLATVADTLVELALRAGGPDNITCVVADVVDVGEPSSTHAVVVGAAAGKHQQGGPATSEIDLSGLPVAQAALRNGGRRLQGWWLRALIAGVVVALIAVGWAGYDWSQAQYYVGAQNGQVAIYKGLPQHLLGKSLSHSVEVTEVPLSDLPTLDRDKVQDSIFASSLNEAHQVLSRLRVAAAGCRQDRANAAAAAAAAATATPTPTPAEPIAGVSSGRATASPGATDLAEPSTAPSPQPTPAAPGCSGATA